MTDELVEPIQKANKPANAFAMKFDAGCRKIDENLKDIRPIIAIYGMLDGLSTSYSMIRYFFDMLCTTNDHSSPDMMHDWMVSPDGIALSALESAFIIGCSIVANVQKEEKNRGCRLIKMSVDPTKDAQKELFESLVQQKKDAIILFNNELYFVNHKWKEKDKNNKKNKEEKVKKLQVNDKNKADFERLKQRFTDDYKLADDDEFQLILSVRGRFQNKFLLFITTYWPYIRDALRGMKNAYKGIRTTFQVLGTLVGQDLRFLMIPFGLVLGVLCIFSRSWIRYVRAERDLILEANNRLLEELKVNLDKINDPYLKEAACAAKLKEIRRESARMRALTNCAAAYGGAVDGLYLYMGVMTLASLIPPLFLMAAIISAAISLLCIVSRVYEQKEEQRRVMSTETKIELLLCGKELEALFAQLQDVSEKLAREQIVRINPAVMMNRLELKYNEFLAKRKKLDSLLNLSYTSAFFSGVRGGLAIYGAGASLVFAAATFTALAGASCPPFLLLATALAGVAILVGCITFTLIKNYLHRREKKRHEANPIGQLDKLSKWIDLVKTNREYVNGLETTQLKRMVNDSFFVDNSPLLYYQERSELTRATGSALGKGSKAVDFVLNWMQEKDQKGHYKDTPVMVGISLVTSLVYALFFLHKANSAYVRAIDKDNKFIHKLTPKSSSKDKTVSELPSSDKMVLEQPPASPGISSRRDAEASPFGSGRWEPAVKKNPTAGSKQHPIRFSTPSPTTQFVPLHTPLSSSCSSSTSSSPISSDPSPTTITSTIRPVNREDFYSPISRKYKPTNVQATLRPSSTSNFESVGNNRSAFFSPRKQEPNPCSPGTVPGLI